MDILQIINTSKANAASSYEVMKGPYRIDLRSTDPIVTSSGDSVQLSQESTILNSLTQGKLEWGIPIKTVPPIPHTAEELGTWFDKYQQAVRENIQKLFETNNIQLQQPVTLQNSNDGNVQVDGQHPQSQEIQQLVNDNPQVASQLQTLNQRSDLFDALAHGNNLRQSSNDGEYTQAAAALSEHLSNPAPFRLTVSPSSTSTSSDTQSA